MSLPFNMLSRLVITFLPRSKCLFISWLQSPSAVILQPKKNKIWHCFPCFPNYLLWSDGTRCHDLSFLNVELLSQLFHSPLSKSLQLYPMDCGPPGSSVHGILQSRILEWIAMPSSRGSSWSRSQTQVSCLPHWQASYLPPGTSQGCHLGSPWGWSVFPT